MKSQAVFRTISALALVLGGLALATFSWQPAVAQHPAANSNPMASATSLPDVRTFSSPQEAANVLIEAAGKFDVPALTQIFGHDTEDVIFSGEFAQDRKHAADFVA